MKWLIASCTMAVIGCIQMNTNHNATLQATSMIVFVIGVLASLYLVFTLPNR